MFTADVTARTVAHHASKCVKDYVVNFPTYENLIDHEKTQKNYPKNAKVASTVSMQLKATESNQKQLTQSQRSHDSRYNYHMMERTNFPRTSSLV